MGSDGYASRSFCLFGQYLPQPNGDGNLRKNIKRNGYQQYFQQRWSWLLYGK